MNLQDILQSGYQQFKQSDIPVATLLRGEYNNFFPSVGRNLSAQLDTLSTPEGAIDLINPMAKVGGLLGTIKNSSLLTGDAWKQANKVSQRQVRNNDVVNALQQLKAGKIDNETYRSVMKEKMPVGLLDEVPTPPSLHDIEQSILATAGERGVSKGILGKNKKITDGTRISSRLDIPSYNDYDKWIVSAHDGTTKSGSVVGYGKTAHLTNNVLFQTNPKAAFNIALGKPKATIARINGDWKNTDPDKLTKMAKEKLNDPDWVQVGMNPFRGSSFYDKKDLMPLSSAEEVIQVGNLVLAKKPVKVSPNDPMFSFIDKETGGLLSF